jgi:hypothetical protein
MAPVSVLAMRSSLDSSVPSRWLIAQTRRHLAHQPGYFHAGLEESENIIDQQ